jgi:hypothetical protein
MGMGGGSCGIVSSRGVGVGAMAGIALVEEVAGESGADEKVLPFESKLPKASSLAL